MVQDNQALPTRLEVDTNLVQAHGVLTALMAADLYWWLVTLDKPRRWVPYQRWALMFCVSTDTIKRQQSKLAGLFVVERTRRKNAAGRAVLGANCYSLHQWRKDQVKRNRKPQTACNNDAGATGDLVVFPLEYIQLAIKYGNNSSPAGFAWFLYRVSRLLFLNQHRKSASAVTSFKSMEWLAHYCQLPKRTLERYTEQARRTGAVVIVGNHIAAPGAAEAELMAPLYRIELERETALINLLANDSTAKPYLQDWADDMLYQLKRSS